jgi:4-diphosphocytidyl-2-C-methyl-D-erythritol kinase
VAFAGCCDRLSFTPAKRLELSIDGPTAANAGPLDSNLVLRAARELASRAPKLRVGRFHLRKSLPAAAGLGGGSANAAAALRALAHHNDLSLDDPRVLQAARAAGADVAVCVWSHARVMQGLGEILGPRLDLPPIPAVLVNPGVAVETRAVFAQMGLARGEENSASPRPTPYDLTNRDALFACLRDGRNHMQDAALKLAPAIGETLEALSRSRTAFATRMSGSGATCFALFHDRHAAARAAAEIAAARPDWWVRATMLR